MIVMDLIGRSIIEVWVDVRYEHGGIDMADSFLLLDNDTLIGFPWSFDQGNDELWIRTLPDQPRKLLSIANPVRSKVLHQSIMDIMCFEERLFTDKAMLLLANGVVITEVTVGMHGTGYAGLWCFDSIDDLSSRWGSNYRRLVC